MATQVKHRRGTNTEIMAGTPAQGELWFNTTDGSIHMGDGFTAGGIKHATLSRAVAVSLNTEVENVIFSTNTTDAIPAYIYNEDNQLSYLVTSDAQGKFIDTVVDNLLTTTDASTYTLPLAINTANGNVSDYMSLDGATNNTADLELLSANQQGGAFNMNETAVIDDFIQAEDVTYIGTGKFDTKNTPNTPTVGLSSTLGGGFNSISPDRHFRQASATAANGDAIKVVIMGDSLSTPFADVDGYMVNSADNLWGYLQRGLKKSNPFTEFNFVNRAVGGMTFTNANGNIYGLTPTNILWYTENKDWLDYIIDEEPDVLVISFGMNDRENISISQFRALMSKIRSMTKAPDLIFATCMVPSRMSTNDDISSNKSNEGRDFASGYVRHYAQSNDIALIDINRQYHLVRDGCDVENTYMERVQDEVSVSTPHSFDDNLCSNFTLDIDIASLDAGTLNDLETSGLDRLRIYTAPERGTNNPNSTSYIELGTIGGNLAVEVSDVYNAGFNANYGYGYVWLDSGVTAPSAGAPCRLTVTIKGGNLVLALDNEIVLNEQIQRLGQAFAPSISSRLGTITQSMTVTLYQGKYTKICHSLMTDAEIWDHYEGEDNGGNSLNHPNTRAISCIYGVAVDSSDLRIPSITSGATDYRETKGRKVGIGQANPIGLTHIGNGSSTANVSGDSSDLVVQGGSQVGSTYAVEDGGVFRQRVSTPSNQLAYVEAFVTSSLQKSTIINGVTVERIISTPGSGNTGTAILVNKDGTVSLESIKLGAEDSGGTGFRALVVSN